MTTIGGRFRAAALMGAVALAVAFAVGAQAQNQNNPWPYNKLGRSSPVLAVVGDISCQPAAEVPGESGSEVCTDAPSPYTSTSLWLSQMATANQIENMKPNAVALLGDLQYQVGGYSDFKGSFDLTYGAFKFLQRPAPGNHEFYNEHGQMGVAGYGYFSYFNGFQLNPIGNGMMVTTPIPNPCPTPSSSCKAPGGAAVPSSQPIPLEDGQAGHFDLGANGGLNGTGVGDGWYSYNLGSWHLISLNIECYTQPGGCNDNGAWFAAELEWLKNDLEANHSACTLAYWHQPTYSAADSLTQEGTTAVAFWQLLYQYHADLVLNGHDHLYARYRPLDPSGNYDPRNGIREFIVGTGGETLDKVVKTNTTTADPSGNPNFNAANLEAASGDFWGVMALTLDDHGYRWNFTPALELPGDAAGPFSDSGVGTCHDRPVDNDRDDHSRDDNDHK